MLDASGSAWVQTLPEAADGAGSRGCRGPPETSVAVLSGVREREYATSANDEGVALGLP